MHHNNFKRNAWYQSYKFNIAWVWTCPKEHIRLNARHFPVVTQTYFGVKQECLRGLEGPTIQQKTGGGIDDIVVECDPYGENLVKATLHGSRWTCHHDEINGEIHRIIRQSGTVSQIEIEDYFIRKLQGMAVTLNDSMPILIKHLRGHFPDGRQLGIASNMFPG